MPRRLASAALRPNGGFPMPRKFVDLSIYLENDVVSRSAGLRAEDPVLHAREHLRADRALLPRPAEGGPARRRRLGGGDRALSTHNGTHLDAPYHFHRTMNRALGEQERSIAIDEVPLEWCFQPGVKLDFRHFPDGYVVTRRRRARRNSRASATRCSRWRSWWSTPAPARATASADYVVGRLRHGLRGDHVPAGARRAPDRHRRLELGRALRAHGEEVRRERTTPR